MDVWELNSEDVASLWPKASTNGARRAVPLFNYTLAIALKLKKERKT
jgi:hypothetical protein